ncbi:MBL fold metallo-hydrolase [Microlunatus soli]|uniref:Glyoxylase, beta-lactamase superfamily II n=1 Tax=Microlunatus soli TaxID=630515 RepID=A0A1H1V5H3_9ACTN|nr:MBL fold metallo-hydrolase [Microlunatus soli]SDS79997.1 Glyoxylase, beta-lactamase superfamily II [Microlunatus soli]
MSDLDPEYQDFEEDEEPDFGPHGDAGIDHAVVSGTFSLDGQTFDVENNIWVIGDDAECVVIDAPHDVAEILKVIDDRRVIAILCTHGHDDHVRFAPDLGRATGARVLLHGDDLPVWRLTHRKDPDGALRDGQLIPIAGIDLRVIHTPGHTPGAVCFYAEEFPGYDNGVLFTGDTLFEGGPGATGRSFSDHDQIVESIRTRLLTLPDDTEVLTGHGPSTTIGAERANVN